MLWFLAVIWSSKPFNCTCSTSQMFILDSSCDLWFLFLSGFCQWLGKLKEKTGIFSARNHTLDAQTNSWIGVSNASDSAKPKNAVCINRFGQKNASHHACVWRRDSYVSRSGGFGIRYTPRPVRYTKDIFPFCCFILFLHASISVYAVMFHWKWAHGVVLCVSVGVVSSRCEKGQRGFPVHRLYLIKKEWRTKRGSYWEIERGKPRMWSCLAELQIKWYNLCFIFRFQI